MYVAAMPSPNDAPSMLAPPRTVLTRRSDGTFVMASPEPLAPYARCVGEWIEHWARRTPEALALAERDAGGAWRTVSWGELRVAIGRIAQSLLGLHLPAGAPVVVL